MNVAIVDYGMGNIHSITGALRHVGVSDVSVTADPVKLRSADRLILPGVGAYGMAMARIKEKNIDGLLRDLVIKDKKPILGICLGMQLLGLSSEENGHNKGLGFINGVVKRFFESKEVRVPHVGFNQVVVDRKLKLYRGFSKTVDFYFTHSYMMVPCAGISQCLCSYGEDFVASYEVENVAGVQFHPELSQSNGLSLLRNFVEYF